MFLYRFYPWSTFLPDFLRICDYRSCLHWKVLCKQILILSQAKIRLAMLSRACCIYSFHIFARILCICLPESSLGRFLIPSRVRDWRKPLGVNNSNISVITILSRTSGFGLKSRYGSMTEWINQCMLNHIPFHETCIINSGPALVYLMLTSIVWL